MAARTFEQIWRLVWLHAPDAPVTLVQTWTQDAYDQLLGKRHWAWLRRDVLLRVRPALALTVEVTEGSPTVLSAALFTAEMAGRQFRVGGTGPVYTIDTVTDASTLELTEAYGGASTADAQATISDIYLAMPADFRSFYTVTDLENQRPIPWWLRRDYLDYVDPARTQSDTRLRALVGYQVAQDTSRVGRMLYEAWPHPTGAATYRLLYFARTDQLLNTQPMQGVLATHTENLRLGALARCAMWPGTAQAKNPYFNLKLAQALEGQFQQACADLQVMDDDQYLDSLEQVDLSPFGLGALAGGTERLRASDATLDSYY